MTQTKFKKLTADDYIWVYDVIQDETDQADVEAHLISRALDVMVEDVYDMKDPEVVDVEEDVKSQVNDFNAYVLEDSGSVRVDLKHPIGDLDTIRILPPSVRDRIGNSTTNTMKRVCQEISRICSIPEKTVRSIRIGDFSEVARARMYFRRKRDPQDSLS